MKRICYLGLGHICVILAIIGAILPVMPTVVFLIIAAWAYGKSSERFQRLILENRRYGPMIRNWQEFGVVPTKVKIVSGVMMAASASMCFYKAHDKLWPIILIVSFVLIYAYILTRPSQLPDLSATSLSPESDQH